MFVVGEYYRTHISHTTITYFHCVVVKYFMKFMSSGKWWSRSLRNKFPTVVFTLWEYGGLSHIIFRFLCSLCWLFSSWFCVGIGHLISALLQSIFIMRNWLVKNTFIWWNFWNSFWNWFLKLLRYWWFMIEFYVNVQRVMINYS